jgi:hypothetical protein
VINKNLNLNYFIFRRFCEGRCGQTPRKWQESIRRLFILINPPQLCEETFVIPPCFDGLTYIDGNAWSGAKTPVTFTMNTTWLQPEQQVAARGSTNKSHLYSMCLRPLALLLLLTAFASPADAQRRKRPQNDRQTPKTVSESIRSAEEKEAARTLELQTGWDGAKEAHFTKQDRATRRRMKRTAKKVTTISKWPFRPLVETNLR